MAVMQLFGCQPLNTKEEEEEVRLANT